MVTSVPHVACCDEAINEGRRSVIDNHPAPLGNQERKFISSYDAGSARSQRNPLENAATFSGLLSVPRLLRLPISRDFGVLSYCFYATRFPPRRLLILLRLIKDSLLILTPNFCYRSPTSRASVKRRPGIPTL